MWRHWPLHSLFDAWFPLRVCVWWPDDPWTASSLVCLHAKLYSMASWIIRAHSKTSLPASSNQINYTGVLFLQFRTRQWKCCIVRPNKGMSSYLIGSETWQRVCDWSKTFFLYDGVHQLWHLQQFAMLWQCKRINGPRGDGSRLFSDVQNLREPAWPLAPS